MSDIWYGYSTINGTTQYCTFNSEPAMTPGLVLMTKEEYDAAIASLAPPPDPGEEISADEALDIILGYDDGED